MTDKAKCYFQTINIGDAPTARASLNQIRNAAAALFMKCAASDTFQGGIIKNIGNLRRSFSNPTRTIDLLLSSLIQPKADLRMNSRWRQQPRRHHGHLPTPGHLPRNFRPSKFLRRHPSRYASNNVAGGFRSAWYATCERRARASAANRFE